MVDVVEWGRGCNINRNRFPSDQSALNGQPCSNALEGGMEDIDFHSPLDTVRRAMDMMDGNLLCKQDTPGGLMMVWNVEEERVDFQLALAGYIIKYD